MGKCGVSCNTMDHVDDKCCYECRDNKFCKKVCSVFVEKGEDYVFATECGAYIPEEIEVEVLIKK